MRRQTLACILLVAMMAAACFPFVKRFCVEHDDSDLEFCVEVGN